MNDDEALEILRKLADGIDPEIGDELPDESPYNQAKVVRALHRAVEALEGEPKRERQSNRPPKPARTGQPWDSEEDGKLLHTYDSGIKIEVIAEDHQRSRGAIRSRLVKHGRIDNLNVDSKADDYPL